MNKAGKTTSPADRSPRTAVGLLRPLSSTILIGFFIPFSVFVNNWGEVYARELWLVLGLIIIVSGVVFSIALGMKGDPHRVGIAGAILWIAFFNGYHVCFILSTIGIGAVFQTILTILFIVGVVFLVHWIKAAVAPVVSTFLLVTSLCLYIFPLIQTGEKLATDHRQSHAEAGHIGNSDAAKKVGGTADWFDGDLFYFILDAYGSKETLTRYIGLDNSPFLDELERRGFVISDGSVTNYNKTIPSIPSSLHMIYLDSLNGRNKDAFGEVVRSLRYAEVLREFREHGYKTVWITTTSPLNMSGGYIDRFLPYSAPGQYLVSLYGMTPLQFFPFINRLTSFGADRWTANASPNPWNPASIEFAFDQAKKCVGNKQQEFVFVHVMCPHWPFYYDSTGAVNPQSRYVPNDSRAAYYGNALGLNKMILAFLDYVDVHADVPPIIVLQGDHGPRRPEEELKFPTGLYYFGILNAFSVPDTMKSRFHNGMTPVNTFRIITNALFDAGHPLLPDHSYYVDDNKRVGISLVNADSVAHRE